MLHPLPHALPKHARRIQAVLALLRGEPVADVSTRYRICRSDLYKYRRRALTAMRQGLADRRRGPRRPHNRLPVAREQPVAVLCHDRPPWSSYTVHQRVGPDAPSPRTIQRVRQRHGLSRLPKRAPTVLPARRLDPVTRSRVDAMLQEKPHLGPERTAWDLRNGEGLTVSP